MIAQPYDARQCPICREWVYIANGPFAEDDPTKTEADYLHWEAKHAAPEELTGVAVGFPFFRYNDTPITVTPTERT